MDELKVLVTTILCFGLLIWLLLLGDQAYRDHACDNYSKTTKREVKYVYWTGCFAKNKNGEFSYWKEFIQVEEAK